MHSYLISDNRDSLVGMRMAGIDGIIVNTSEAAQNEFNKAVSNDGIGIIFLTEKVGDMIHEKLEEHRKKSLFPLIAVIPDRHGFQKHGVVTQAIKEAIGM